MKVASTFVLAPSERLAGIRKEKYTKPHGGKAIAYIISDRLGELEFLGQKLERLCSAINQHVGDEQWARVSVNGLWESIDRTTGRTGPWCKGRWRVTSVELERACEEYERERTRHIQSMIVADQPSCYAICA